MTGQGLAFGLFFLIALVTLTSFKHRLKPSIEDFGGMTANRSSLAAMPVAQGHRTTMRKNRGSVVVFRRGDRAFGTWCD
jgi:hypothetical protein